MVRAVHLALDDREKRRATKDGQSYDIALNRDGTINEMPVFSMDDAKKNILAKGYELVGEPQKVSHHFEALGRKNTEYFEVHAHRDGAVKEARKLDKTDKTDPKWGAQIP